MHSVTSLSGAIAAIVLAHSAIAAPSSSEGRRLDKRNAFDDIRKNDPFFNNNEKWKKENGLSDKKSEKEETDGDVGLTDKKTAKEKNRADGDVGLTDDQKKTAAGLTGGMLALAIGLPIGGCLCISACIGVCVCAGKSNEGDNAQGQQTYPMGTVGGVPDQQYPMYPQGSNFQPALDYPQQYPPSYNQQGAYAM